MNEQINEPIPEFVDVIAAFQSMRPASIDWDAFSFMKPPYMSMFDSVLAPAWTRPTEEDLRAHLLKSWTPSEVGAYFARRLQQELQRQARAEWEATFRGRVTLRCRSIRNEVRERVRESWKILRHGVEEDY